MPIRPEDRARYPSDWRAISLRIRNDRAGWRCECTGECGQDHGGRCWAHDGSTTKRGATVVLTVAHLNHTPEDCRDNNLLALCQACHLRLDAALHRRHRHETARKRRLEAGQLELLEVRGG